MNPKQLNVLLGAVAIIALIAVGYMALSNKTKDQTLGTQNSTPASNTVTPSNSDTTKPLDKAQNQSISNPLIYKDSKYGFQLSFPAVWKGFTTQSKPLDGASSLVYLCIPTKDTKWTGDCPKGYADMLAISVYTKAQWKTTQNEGGPTPSYLGEGSNFVVGYMTGQDAPSDLMNVDLGIESIVSSFKLIK